VGERGTETESIAATSWSRLEIFIDMASLTPGTLRKLNIPAAFLLCTAASFLALRQLGYPLIGIDDANIYFVYARNLANGYGFVYNLGGERVEGFTSLLWTLISALAFRLAAHPELILLTINIVLVSIGMRAALNYLQQTYPGKDRKWHVELFWSALFLILMFSSPRYIVWNTITLMENALWSTLLLLTTIFVIQEQPSVRAMNLGFIPLSILLLLSRPESIAWVVVFAAILFLRLALQSNAADALKSLASSIVSIFVALTLLTLFTKYLLCKSITLVHLQSETGSGVFFQIFCFRPGCDVVRSRYFPRRFTNGFYCFFETCTGPSLFLPSDHCRNCSFRTGVRGWGPLWFIPCLSEHLSYRSIIPARSAAPRAA
jgi:hypothetical protein